MPSSMISGGMGVRLGLARLSRKGKRRRLVLVAYYVIHKSRKAGIRCMRDMDVRQAESGCDGAFLKRNRGYHCKPA
jgi:hypothetical protein